MSTAAMVEITHAYTTRIVTHTSDFFSEQFAQFARANAKEVHL